MNEASHIISDRARNGLDHFIGQAAKRSLVPPGAECKLVSLGTVPANDVHRSVVMFTISSYRFRVVMFMHLERSVLTRAYLASLSDATDEEMNDARFEAELTERGNLCCGALNRDLAHFFPHIGMSTPCLLRGSSLEHIAAVSPVLIRHYQLEVGPEVSIRFTLALCADEDFDFQFDHRHHEEDSGGELEMF